MDKVLEVRNLIVRRKEFSLTLPSLTLRRGKITCVVGKSGSGKSTLLQALCGFIEVESGEIIRTGERIDALPSEKRHLALVFQSNALFLAKTVEENIGFPLLLQNKSKEEVSRITLEWGERLKIQSLLRKKATEISGGEAQRVQLARAFAASFPVLLLDEPFSSLDIILRRQLRSILKELMTSSGAGVLFVTHSMEDVESLADEVLVLESGKVSFQGSKQQAMHEINAYLEELRS